MLHKYFSPFGSAVSFGLAFSMVSAVLFDPAASFGSVVATSVVATILDIHIKGSKKFFHEKIG